MKIASCTGIIILTIMTAGSIKAQLCQGSLGDPIVNRTFGAGSNPGLPLAAATTNYQYALNDCPNDGYYTVRNRTDSCFVNGWYSLPADHTGDPNGYFMLINASVQPSAFYLDTVRGLCSNTTYEFAAWVLNILRPSSCSGNGNQPNLTFSIEKTDGSLLQSYNSGNIPTQNSPTWQQFGFFFNTALGVTDIVIRIVNNSPGGCGNDLAMDDITLRACGPQLISSIAGNSSNTVSYCQGQARSFTFNCTVSAGFNNPSFQWQQRINGANWTDIPGAVSILYIKNFAAGTTAAVYEYRLAAAESGNMGSLFCRVVSPVLTINIKDNPLPAINNNGPLCERDTLFLNASGGLQYQWSGPNNFSASGAGVSINNVLTTQSGIYHVLVTNAAGCSTPDSVTVIIHPAPVAVPVFTSASICEGDHIQLGSSGGNAYRWIPSTGLSSTMIPDPIASPADTIQYKLIVFNSFSCSDTALVTVNVAEKPRANAGPDKTIMAGDSVQLTGHVSGQDISYTWSPVINIVNAQSLQPLVNPATDIDYALTVISNAGCGEVTDITHVFVYKDVFVPTAFTPNGDGLNDTWAIPALDAFTHFTVTIFNRWGGIVFQAKNINKHWDGKFKGLPQPAGEYVYIVNLEELDRTLKGMVMLIR